MPSLQERWDAVTEAIIEGHIYETFRKDLKTQSGVDEPPYGLEIQDDITDNFLTPKQVFPDEWAKKAQISWCEDLNYASLLPLEPSKPRTHIELVHSGLDGDVVAFRENLVQGADFHARNSTSLQRKPASMTDFVRGKAGQFPFIPGGLEMAIKGDIKDDSQQGLDEQLELQPQALLSIPPGFPRGLNMNMKTGDSEFSLDESRNFTSIATRYRPLIPPMMTTSGRNGTKDALFGSDIIDDLLPTELPHMLIPASFNRRLEKTRDWAHVVDVNQELTNFYELVPDMAYKYPFELDNFQKEAVYHLENGDSVFVAAHTSAGKTVVAEYAIALAAKHMTRAIYTSPIKALSNQKFRDFKNTFSDVGILTGDVQINPEASCLIMTTEILRSMLYRGADLIRDVEFVIFDEVHYVNDMERGVVWEEVIIMLPDHVNLILLSATVPNTKEFAEWVGRTKKKDIYVISTPKRPVPLEHYLYAGRDLHKIVDAKKQFITAGWKGAKEAMMKKEKEIKPPGGGNGDARGMRGGRGAGPNRARGVTTTHFSRGRGGFRTMERQDRNLWVHLIGLLRKTNLLPVVVFTFSKKRCEENAASMPNTDLCTASEKSEIHVMIEKSLNRLRAEDKQLPQILRMRDMLSRGVGVHHGGLLPIVKEVVELLFARGLVKVLFATETFAMGVNMPARTVVFANIRKHDGRNFRDLLPGEYTQMSGRAGRRGLDTTGMVIIVCTEDEPPDTGTLHKMILGEPTKLKSQFRLTYNMILNLLRVEALRVEEMMKRSFSENAAQRLVPEAERKVLEGEESLSMLRKLNCQECLEGGIHAYYDVSLEIVNVYQAIMMKAMNSAHGIRILSSGRVVVLVDGNYRYVPAVILRQGTGYTESQRTFWVVIVVDGRKSRRNNTKMEFEADVVPPRQVKRVRLPAEDSYVGVVAEVSWSSIGLVTNTMMKMDVEAIVDRRKKAILQSSAKELFDKAKEMISMGKLVEVDWSKIHGLEFQELLKRKQELIEKLDEYSCINCRAFDDHYMVLHGERLLKTNISKLKESISEQNLELLPDYETRLEVLKKLQFIDENATVQLKGRVGSEINTANELILTELILDNTLADYDAEEVVALLSAFVFQEKSENEPSLTSALDKGKHVMINIAERIKRLQEDLKANFAEDEMNNPLNFGLMEVVYEWANGMPFEQITELTDVQEGAIVRCITRLDETCREVRDAARLIGDAALYQKMETAREKIKRDIIFAGSLYF